MRSACWQYSAESPSPGGWRTRYELYGLLNSPETQSRPGEVPSCSFQRRQGSAKDWKPLHSASRDRSDTVWHPRNRNLGGTGPKHTLILAACSYLRAECREAVARSFSEVSGDKGRGNRGTPEHKQFQLDLKKKYIYIFLQKERSNTGTILIILSLVIFEGPQGKEAWATWPNWTCFKQRSGLETSGGPLLPKLLLCDCKHEPHAGLHYGMQCL